MSENVKKQLLLNVGLPSDLPKRSKKSRTSKRKKLELTPIKEKVDAVPAQSVAPAYDVQEAQDVVFKPNEGPQTDFLSSSEREVLYGGAAGGGKSYAMLADPLHGLNNAKLQWTTSTTHY